MRVPLRHRPVVLCGLHEHEPRKRKHVLLELIAAIAADAIVELPIVPAIHGLEVIESSEMSLPAHTRCQIDEHDALIAITAAACPLSPPGHEFVTSTTRRA